MLISTNDCDIIDIFVVTHRDDDNLKIETEFDIYNDDNTYNIIFKEPIKINLVGALKGCFLYVRIKNNIKINNFIISGKAIYFESVIRRKYGATLNNTVEDEAH